MGQGVTDERGAVVSARQCAPLVDASLPGDDGLQRSESERSSLPENISITSQGRGSGIATATGWPGGQ
ncbi:MAG: hypothetical protein WA809_09680 [Candidatus Dormiibacterota bacterium]